MRDKKILTRPLSLNGMEPEDLYEEIGDEYKREELKRPPRQNANYLPRKPLPRTHQMDYRHLKWSRYINQRGVAMKR